VFLAFPPPSARKTESGSERCWRAIKAARSSKLGSVSSTMQSCGADRGFAASGLMVFSMVDAIAELGRCVLRGPRGWHVGRPVARNKNQDSQKLESGDWLAESGALRIPLTQTMRTTLASSQRESCERVLPLKLTWGCDPNGAVACRPGLPHPWV
jgi:hypothetical protein